MEKREKINVIGQGQRVINWTITKRGLGTLGHCPKNILPLGVEGSGKKGRKRSTLR